ncbi:hypothetical protein MRB53_039154 [Persea americana]|nr:hypothetical protein MRB53_039154 [Persea americana]
MAVSSFAYYVKEGDINRRFRVCAATPAEDVKWKAKTGVSLNIAFDAERPPPPPPKKQTPSPFDDFPGGLPSPIVKDVDIPDATEEEEEEEYQEEEDMETAAETAAEL